MDRQADSSSVEQVDQASGCGQAECDYGLQVAGSFASGFGCGFFDVVADED